MKRKLETKDRRIKKTQKSIRDALVDLLSEKDVSEITIKELAERANINRKTFYMHYSSIDDIFDKIENEIIEKLLLILEKYDFFQAQFDGYAFFTSLNNLITEDYDFFEKLVRANSYNFLFTKVKKVLKDTIIEKFHEKFDIDREMLSLYTEFIASGLMSMYAEWFSMNSKLSLEDLAKAGSNIAFNGIKSILAKQVSSF
ncbi:TetR/AcrR family transcriptional regulator [Clostridium drakei]|uniref:TetR family transcriptional regulator n=1 Tax=Clostridium drakei TaxID=332101 RepID=A0A2U8DKD7_9CLOT|nr:TetR/AcrR family transcriptional regulator [Clostridium drakei]AWI03206.1 TetR family transcriptional regulator [Clostridium drakei]